MLPVRQNKNNGFTVVTVHYSADPDKDTTEWVREAKRGMSERAWNREYEIDYSSYAGKPFFPEFKPYNIAEKDIEYHKAEVLYRGWDFGFHRPCCLISKLNDHDQWVWMKVILGEDEGIMEFGKRVRTYCLSHYPGARYIDACDPSGSQITDKSEHTSVQVLHKIGIFPQFRKQTIKQGAEIIRQKLLIRVDGKPGLLVNPSQHMAIDGFRGGIHYPEEKEGRPQREFYEKDGYYDHLFDAARYIATEMFTVIGQQQERNELADQRDEETFRMGSPQTSEENWDQVKNNYGGIDEYF